MEILRLFRERYIADRRSRILVDFLKRMVPGHARVLDVGSGDGRVMGLLAEQRRDLSITGVDVLVRDDARIPVQRYDGVHLPFESKTFDVVVLIDVLHHTEDPRVLLREAVRAARQFIVIKDHLRVGFLADGTLRMLDWAGNRGSGVGLPYTFWHPNQWYDAFGEMNLQIDVWHSDLGLYPAPLSWVFDRSLHFATRLRIGSSGATLASRGDLSLCEERSASNQIA